MPQTEAGVSGSDRTVASPQCDSPMLSAGIQRCVGSVFGLLTSSAFNRGLRCRGSGQNGMRKTRFRVVASAFREWLSEQKRKIFWLSHRCDRWQVCDRWTLSCSHSVIALGETGNRWGRGVWHAKNWQAGTFASYQPRPAAAALALPRSGRTLDTDRVILLSRAGRDCSSKCRSDPTSGYCER